MEPRGSTVHLARQILYTVACDLLLTGHHITAAEAKKLEPDRLMSYPTGKYYPKPLETAEVIWNNGPLAAQKILR